MKDLSTLAKEYHSRYCELNRLNSIRRDTLATYLRWFVAWMTDKAQISRPDQFSSDLIAAWHRYVSARPCRRTGLPQQPGSIYTEVQTIRCFFDWMRRDGYVSSAVLESFPQMRPPVRLPQMALRHAEARQYLESLPMNKPEDYLFRALPNSFTLREPVRRRPFYSMWPTWTFLPERHASWGRVRRSAWCP
jgi:site-specific recombinase XerD